MMITTGVNIENSKKYCDLLIEPAEVGDYGGFDLNNAQTFYNAGYREAKSLILDAKIPT